jgi:hypothetical protein
LIMIGLRVGLCLLGVVGLTLGGVSLEEHHP